VLCAARSEVMACAVQTCGMVWRGARRDSRAVVRGFSVPLLSAVHPVALYTHPAKRLLTARRVLSSWVY
jgi:hypothetical protein